MTTRKILKHEKRVISESFTRRKKLMYLEYKFNVTGAGVQSFIENITNTLPDLEYISLTLDE